MSSNREFEAVYTLPPLKNSAAMIALANIAVSNAGVVINL